MSDQKILVQILEQQKKTNELLQAIVSSQEQLFVTNELFNKSAQIKIDSHKVN